MKIVMVEWVDSFSTTGWQRPSIEANGISKCVSIGLLYIEDDRQVILTQSKSDSGNYSEVMAIPKRSITRMRQLRVNPL